jgi:two-component system CitB family response regulator
LKNDYEYQPIQVLIIEDDLRIAEINRRFAEKVPGYQVIGIATDGDQAKEQLEVLRPDLVLLDIYFPDINGLELLWFIQQHYRETDVIMITAAKELDAVREAIRGGAYDFIIKPLIFERFQTTLLNYRQFYHKIRKLKEESKQVDQEKVDQLLRGVENKGVKDSYLPKGIDKLTLEKVSIAICNVTEGLTAEEVAKEIGASRSTARRYLEYLVSKGEMAADLSYGAVGRPERLYRSTNSS